MNRPYQDSAIKSTHELFKNHRRLLGVCATGGGKTRIAATLINHATQGYGSFAPGRCLVLVNRKQLVDQTVGEIKDTAGIEVGIEQAQTTASHSDRVVVASIDTLKNKLSKYPKDHFEFMVIDEAHLMTGQVAQRVMNHFECKKLGLTATPNNKGKRNLAKFYDAVAFDIPLLRLIKEGYLAPITIKMSPLKIDIHNVSITRGDLDEEELAHEITPYFKAIIQEIQKEEPRKWLIFLPNIATSKAFAALLGMAGIRAEHVDGTMQVGPILKDFKDGKLDALTCSQLLYFGYDEPSIDGIINLRQTKSLNFYEQLIGRGTRKSDATLKNDCAVLDFQWQYPDMGLIRPSFVLADNDSEGAAIHEEIERCGGGDICAIKERVAADAHRKLQEKLRANAKKKGQIVSIIDLAEEHSGLEEIYNHVPTYKPRPASEAQLQALTRHGIDIADVHSSEHAAKILDWLRSRIESGMASLKQLAFLRRLRLPWHLKMTAKEAGWILQHRIGNKKHAKQSVPL